MVMDARVSRSTGGVEPMGIAGRMVRERERLLGMSTEERAWRAQWVKDQHLAPNEPVHVPEYWKERINPIRRFYRAPLDGLYNALKPVLVCSLRFLRDTDFGYVTSVRYSFVILRLESGLLNYVLNFIVQYLPLFSFFLLYFHLKF